MQFEHNSSEIISSKLNSLTILFYKHPNILPLIMMHPIKGTTTIFIDYLVDLTAHNNK